MRGSTVEKKSRPSAVPEFIARHKFLTSIIICLIIFLIYLPLNGFRIYTGGDDPGIDRLISNGEIAIGFVGYFFAGFVSLIQPLFAGLNFYYIFQDIICLLSLAIINYMFLRGLGEKKGLFFSVLFDITFLSFYLITVNFTHTAVAACTAGVLCLVNGCMYETRKSLKWVQAIGGAVLTLVGSQVRFEPFVSLCAVMAAFAFGVFLADLLENKKGSKFNAAFSKSTKKYLKVVIAIVAVAVVVFGTNKVSDVMKNASPGYQEFYEYNNELSRVNDYRIANFFANKDFYRSIGNESFAETNILKMWYVDDDFFTKEKLKKIADYSEKHAADGIGSRSSFHALFSIIGNGVYESAKSGMLIIYAVIFVVVFFLLWILWLLARKKLKVILPAILFAAIWGVLFATTGGPLGGGDNCNLLMMPLAVFTVVCAVMYNRYQQIINLCVTAVVVVLYVYLAISRIHFGAALCIYLPAYVFVILGLDENNRRQFSFKKHPKLLSRIIAAVLVLTSVSTGALLFVRYSYVEYPEDYKQVEEYMESHPDNLFIKDGINRDDSNFNVLAKKNMPDNLISFGGWDKHSRTYQESMKAHDIKHLFPDSIDSNIIVVLYNYTRKKDAIDAKLSNLTIHYNSHYAPKGKYVEFKKVKGFSQYEMYRIITHKIKKAES